MPHFDGYSIKHQDFEYLECAIFVFVSISEYLIVCVVCAVLNVCICISEYLIDCVVRVHYMQY